MTRYPIRLDMDVAWGDMNALGHVSNVEYFRYFENARTLYLEAIGLPNAASILVSARCGYRQPLVHPDRVRIEVGCTRADRTMLTLAFRVFSEKLKAYVAEGDQVVVAYDYQAGTKAPVPL